jgi:hypothetical protein
MHSKKEYANGIVHVSITVNTLKQSVPIMDKGVHGNKQVQFTIYRYIPKHFRRTKTRGEEKFMETLCHQ